MEEIDQDTKKVYKLSTQMKRTNIYKCSSFLSEFANLLLCSSLYYFFIIHFIDKHQFRSMTVYNIYIKELVKEKAIWLAELQGIEFISEVIGVIAELGSNYTKEIKQKGN